VQIRYGSRNIPARQRERRFLTIAEIRVRIIYRVAHGGKKQKQITVAVSAQPDTHDCHSVNGIAHVAVSNRPTLPVRSLSCREKNSL